MKPRVLILADAFLPPMQGTRMRNLARNLQKAGYECQLVCEQTDTSLLPDDIPVLGFRYYPENCSDRRRRCLYLADKVFSLKEKRFARFVREKIDVSSFDCIIGSAYLFPISSVVKVAKAAKKPYIIDLRDIVEQWDGTRFVQHGHENSRLWSMMARLYLIRHLIQRNRVLREAAAVTTISPWHQKQLLQYNPRVSLIYNGFDAETFSYKKQKTLFSITYTGKLYSLSLRNPELLFRAIDKMNREEEFNPYDIELNFYIEQEMHGVVMDLARRCGVEKFVHCMLFVAPDEIPNILSNSAVCLVLNKQYDTDSIHGVLPTKVFEAIGAEKPVLAIPADHDCLQQLIEEQQCGCAASTVEEVRTFLNKCYLEYIEYCYSRRTAKQREKFSRQAEAMQFAELIESVVRK